MWRDRSQPIEQLASSRQIRYANCWEDAAVVCDGLAPLRGARCLSIASAGDNVFCLLAAGAADVVAVDLNPAQLALVELKAAAFAVLEHDEIVRFLGASALGDDPRRAATYRALRSGLGAAACAFWDERPVDIRRGVLHCGRFERYFALFRRFLLPLAHSRRAIAELLTAKAPEERARFHEEVWDTWRWRMAATLFFGRAALGRLGRHPDLFRYVDGPVARSVLERAGRALRALPADDNPYLNYILTGGYGAALPDYLRRENHASIRGGLPRLTLRAVSVEEALDGAPAGRFDAINLSDVPEYMDVASYHALLAAARRAAAPGARFVYWNLFVPRRRPPAMDEWLGEEPARAAELHRRARAFFYSAFVLEVAR